jgi:hypothetical protein
MLRSLASGGAVVTQVDWRERQEGRAAPVQAGIQAWGPHTVEG